jgi:hypothetical protein
MARSTFEGPVLAGNNRFGPLRNVGNVVLAQHVDINLANNVPGTAGYSGASGVFANGSTIRNVNGVVYTPGTSFPPVVATIPADTSSLVYRGVVMYLPTGCDFDGVNIDCQTFPAVAGGSASISSVIAFVSNSFTPSGGSATYFSSTVSGVGRQSLATFSGPQITNQSNTSTDIIQTNGNPNLSQVVITVVIAGSSLDTRTSLTGGFSFFARYVQQDPDIGTPTVYPFGNLD